MTNINKNPQKIKQMFNNIAKDYDKLNEIMTFGLQNSIKKDIVKKINLENPKKILDLCTGTGDIAGLLKSKYPNCEIIGVDFSSEMLKIARQKHANIEFVESDCTNLPFDDESVDICVISFGLRNIESMQTALDEIFRVLKKGGIFVNLDLGKPNKFFNIFLKPYMYIWIAILGKIFHGDETPYKYLAESNETFPSPKELSKIFKSIGFSNIKVKDYFFGQISAQFSTK